MLEKFRDKIKRRRELAILHRSSPSDFQDKFARGEMSETEYMDFAYREQPNELDRLITKTARKLKLIGRR